MSEPSTSCPMPAAWRTWSIGENFTTRTDAEHRVADDAGRLRLVERLAVVPVVWIIAPDDARLVAPPPGPAFHPGYPRHEHTDVELAGRRLHVDHVWASAGGPGRSYAECRVFEAGRLVGRGGYIGCSLGFGGNDSPARVPLGDGRMLLVGLQRVVEVWSTRGRG